MFAVWASSVSIFYLMPATIHRVAKIRFGIFVVLASSVSIFYLMLATVRRVAIGLFWDVCCLGKFRKHLLPDARNCPRGCEWAWFGMFAVWASSVSIFYLMPASVHEVASGWVWDVCCLGKLCSQKRSNSYLFGSLMSVLFRFLCGVATVSIFYQMPATDPRGCEWLGLGFLLFGQVP